MKKYTKLAFLFLAVGLTSCLKEDPALNPEDTNNVLEIYEPIPVPTLSPSGSVYSVYPASFAVSPGENFEIEVSYSGAEAAPQDITVTVALDEAALDEYNAEQGSSYVFMDPSLYTVNSWTVTIPKGQRIAKIPVVFKTNQFDLANTYGFPVKIVSASMGKISSNFGTVIYAVVAKNKWDGVYEMSGSFVDLTTPAFAYWGDQEYHLETVNATQCLVYNATLGTYGYLFLNGTTSTYYGSFGLLVTFDPATDAITSVVNAYGQPSSNGRSAALDPSGANKYNESDRSVDIKYYLLQPGSTIRSQFDEHWTYLHER